MTGENIIKKVLKSYVASCLMDGESIWLFGLQNVNLLFPQKCKFGFFWKEHVFSNRNYSFNIVKLYGVIFKRSE